jgi:hypothetical protein
MSRHGNATLAWTFDPAFRLVSETVEGQTHTLDPYGAIAS